MSFIFDHYFSTYRFSYCFIFQEIGTIFLNLVTLGSSQLKFIASTVRTTGYTSKVRINFLL